MFNYNMPHHHKSHKKQVSLLENIPFFGLLFKKGHKGHKGHKRKGGSQKNTFSSAFNKSPFFTIFKGAAATSFGFMAAEIVQALYVIFFWLIGYHLLKTYNKENTELLEELQTGQYVGIAFFVIGALPFLYYILMFMGFSLGELAIQSAFGDE